jgi:uncharacterized BrkB/YihY/UPF0761 family membrane protein
MPGATVATLLLWITNAAFGLYVRRMPYRLVYGGLAAAIGLMLWMQLVAIVVFIGAAFNAELEALPSEEWAPRRRGDGPMVAHGSMGAKRADSSGAGGVKLSVVVGRRGAR